MSTAQIRLTTLWRREVNRGVDEELLELARDTLPQIRANAVLVRPGSVHAELEGIMGSIHEVQIHVPVLPNKIWPQVARVLRRSAAMLEALGQGRVPRSFDRLVARIAGEPIFPEGRTNEELRRATSDALREAYRTACRMARRRS